MGGEDVTTRIGVDISALKKGINDAKRNIRLVDSEFKRAASSMKNWETSSNGLTAKLDQLSKKLESQKKILANQKIHYEEICRAQGENSIAAKELAIDINYQQMAINKTEREMDDYESALKNVRKAEEMTAKNGKSVEENLKEIAKAADGAGEDAEKAANGGFTVLKGVLANLAANAITAAIQGLKKLGAGAIDIGKQAVTAYAEYEQLAGGVETLFGAGGQSIEDYAESVGKSVDEVKGEYAKLMTAQDSVIKNANNAYKTAGLSANEYMETVTSFSASLIAALDGDTVAAAGAADMAITDMSDNANKMGTDMESIQNAYQGFAKQNYTMLDNLKLGYGGTKAEMERLLTDAEKLTGKKFDLENFADITEAIHAVQTEMGITGTTAEEASQTIEGSVDSMKAAWKNMLAGLAAGDEMDMSQLTANLIDSVVTAGENLIPRIKTVIGSVSQQLPTMINALLPIVIQSGSEIIATLAQSLLQSSPMLLQSGIDLLLELVHGIAKGLPKAVPQIVDAVIQITEIILDNLDKLIDAGVEIIMALIDGMIEAEPEFLEKVPELLEKLAAAILSGAAKLGEAMLQLTAVMLENFISKIPDYAKAGKEILRVLKDALLSDLAGQVDVGLRLVQGIWEGISSGTAWIKGKITAWVGDVVSFIKNLFGIHSPSKVMENEVGKNIALGIIKGVDDEKKNVKKSAEELANLYVSAAKNRASELKKANKLTEKQEIVFWKEIVSHCKKGTKAYNTAAAQLTTARNTLKKDITELTQTYVSGIGKVREQLQNDIAQLQNKYVDTVTSRVSDITKSFGLLNSVSFDEALSKDDLTRNLSEQTYAIEEWDKVLRSLEGRLGRDSGLYLQLQQMDVSSLETLKSINSMTDEELKRYEYLYNRKQTLAQQRAEYEYAGLKEQTEAQVKELEKSANKQMTELKQAYKKGLKQLGVTVGKESGGIGEAISAGIASGLKKGTAELDGTLKSFAKSTLKKLKQEWGIKSPSRVMRDQVGKYLALGIADGIKSNQDVVSKAMESLKQSLVSDVNFDFGAAKSRIVAAGTSGHAEQNGNGQTSTSTYTFNQYNNSPKALSRLEIYRQTHNILNYAKGE